MSLRDTPFAGLKIIEPRVYPDHRGLFLETYNFQRYTTEGLDEIFVQDNLSHSKRGVLRGLHFQYPTWQGKLVHVVQGEIFDVAVDIRPDSPTFGQWFGVTLSSENRRQLYISPGFAHGFCVLSETADVMYKCTAYYKPEEEQTLLWNDPTLAIKWPVAQPVMSEKDLRGKLLKDIVIPA